MYNDIAPRYNHLCRTGASCRRSIMSWTMKAENNSADRTRQTILRDIHKGAHDRRHDSTINPEEHASELRQVAFLVGLQGPRC